MEAPQQALSKNVQSSAHRALAALEIICASAKPVTLVELADQLGAPKATAYRSAETLVSSGFIKAAGEGKPGYEATWRVVELSTTILGRSELRNIAQPLLRGLAEGHGESVTLAVPDGAEVLFVDRITGNRHVEFYCDVGRRLPLHVGAASRAILAHFPSALFDQYVGGTLPSFTPSTLTTAKKLRADRDLTRARGFAISQEDVEVGISAVAAPIVNKQGDILGAAAIANLSARWSEGDIEERGAEIARTCQEIGERCEQLTQQLGPLT
ncbi:IclR family transcriptional regulator [Homoserinimonas sp. OAct 916]|uniref:IclR family transcriptional regulator n=1 Tax=Homoserinimonas sp. OAct 916 TaxID=2211450 RepID=UPI0018E5458D|nr:IclR family transcriptional regulator [Homoserinimonas sp. OAct 916]